MERLPKNPVNCCAPVDVSIVRSGFEIPIRTPEGTVSEQGGVRHVFGIPYLDRQVCGSANIPFCPGPVSLEQTMGGLRCDHDTCPSHLLYQPPQT